MYRFRNENHSVKLIYNFYKITNIILMRTMNCLANTTFKLVKSPMFDAFWLCWCIINLNFWDIVLIKLARVTLILRYILLEIYIMRKQYRKY